MAGETTLVGASTARNFYDNPGAGLFVVPFNLTFGTGDTELNDIMQAGYLAGNTRVIAYTYSATAMAASALVQKITVGGVDIATGLTNAVAGTIATGPALTLPTTAAGTPALVQVQTTTAAVTPAAGTAVLLLHCQKA